jgi:hypothetical protein
MKQPPVVVAGSATRLICLAFLLELSTGSMLARFLRSEREAGSFNPETTERDRSIAFSMRIAAFSQLKETQS